LQGGSFQTRLESRVQEDPAYVSSCCKEITTMNRLRCLVPLLAVLGLVAHAAGPEDALLEAVRRGDVVTVRTLLASATAVNAAAPDGTTPLHVAVQRDDAETVTLLLRAGANARAASRYGVTPLYLACINGTPAIIDALLAAGADPNTSLPEGEPAIMTAARNGSVGAVRTLLAHGANPNAQDGWKGQTALMWAAARNNAAAAQALVAAGADIHVKTKSGFTAFLFAVRGGRIDAARVLLDAGADISAPLPNGQSPIILALWNAHYEMAGFLLDRGADPNSDTPGWTPLHQIVWSRRPPTGFNLPGPVPTGSLDSLDLVKKLLQRGADVNRRQKKEPKDGFRNMLYRIGATPFLLAAKNVDLPLMRLLLANGADPALKTEDGSTALMVAAGVGIWAPGENPGNDEEALEAVKLTFEVGGGAVTDVDANGETALHGAVYRAGSIAIAKFLIERGAKLDAVNGRGWTPLIAADGVEYTPTVLKRYPDMARFLRQVMRERGLPVPDPNDGAQVSVPGPPITPAGR
jgi:ankyrin repeat protein